MTTKTNLLNAIAGKNRGLLATETDKQAILAAIATLEDLNPTPHPLESSHLLDGNWRLLYTTSKELLRLDKLPFYKLGQIYQCIRVENQRVYNIAEIYGLPFLEGLIGVTANFEPVSNRRIKVNFERSIIGLQSLIRYQSPNKFIQQIEASCKFTAIDFTVKSSERPGWLDITYIDNDLRIGRGNQGSVFVLVKT